MRWQVVVPIRPARTGKSRLRPATTSQAGHERLVRAVQQDTLDAVLALDRDLLAGVVVTTPDPEDTGSVLDGRTARIVDDGGVPLNDAIAAAASAVSHSAADGILVVLADLPCMRAGDLRAVLLAAEGTRGFVADRAGTGTTMLAASAGRALDPRFGTGSAAAHALSGAVSLPADEHARADVDTVADLAHDRVLGLGPATTQVLAELAAAGALRI